MSGPGAAVLAAVAVALAPAPARGGPGAPVPAPTPAPAATDRDGLDDGDEAPLVLEGEDAPSAAAAGGIPAAPAAAALRLGVLSRLLAGVDPDAQEPLQTWHMLRAAATLAPTPHLRARLAARLRLGAWADRERVRQWASEVALEEASVGMATGGVSLTVGALRLGWGRHEFGAPADGLAPVDVRLDPSAALAWPAVVRPPAAAAALTVVGGAGALELVVLPFFAPSRAYLFGHDLALVRADRLPAPLAALAARLDPSVRDALNLDRLATQLPEDGANAWTGGLRLSSRVHGWDVAVTVVAGRNRVPHVEVDPRLLAIANLPALAPLAAAQPALAGTLLAGSARDVAAALGGGVPVSITYRRREVVAVDAEGPVGPLLLRADVGLALGQTHVTQAAEAVELPTAVGLVSLDWTPGESLLSLGALAEAAIGPPAGSPLWGLQAADALPAQGAAVAYGLQAAGRVAFAAPNLVLSGGGVWRIAPGEVGAWLQLAARWFAPHELSVGVQGGGGVDGTAGSRLTVLRQLLLQYSYAS